MKKTDFKIIDDDGNWCVNFEEDGKQCKSFIIDLEKSKPAKQYSAYGLIGDDLDFIRRQAILLKEGVVLFEQKNNNGKSLSKFNLIGSESRDVREHFFMTYVSLCIIYRRLFNSNDSRGLTLNKKDVVGSKYITIHENLMDCANRYIAHSSNSMYEESKVFIVLDNKKNPHVTYHTRKIYFPSASTLAITIEYIDNLLCKIRNKFISLQAKLENDYVNSKLDLIDNN